MMRLVSLFSTGKNLKSEKFLNLVKPPLGITRAISPEEKQKINQQITQKMEELEQTGLSREQILLSKSQKGIPLKTDPFFQFLKNNLKARQVYLKTNDRFTVENVIDIALRQDIGGDPSTSRVRALDKVDTKGRAELLNQMKDLKEGKFNPESYDGTNNFTVQKAYDELKPHQPLRHYFKPLDRYEKRQQNLRQLKKYDIHWRNIQLLRQFVTNNGMIKSRFKNYLSDSDQRVAKLAIKTARLMGAMPYYGRTPEPLKRNITSLQDEVQEIGYQHVNLQTGHLFQTRTRSLDSLQVQIENENDLDYKYDKMINDPKNYKIWVNSLEKQTNEEDLKAEKYARHLKDIQVEKSSQKKQALKQNVHNVLTGIAKFKALRDEVKVQKSEDEQCLQQFKKERRYILESLDNNPDEVVNRLLYDKLRI